MALEAPEDMLVQARAFLRQAEAGVDVFSTLTTRSEFALRLAEGYIELAKVANRVNPNLGDHS